MSGSEVEGLDELSAKHTRELCVNVRVERVKDIEVLAVVRCTVVRRERLQSIGLKLMARIPREGALEETRCGTKGSKGKEERRRKKVKYYETKIRYQPRGNIRGFGIGGDLQGTFRAGR